MVGVLRFIGVTNAAIWLGTVVFFTLRVRTAFFTPEMLYWFGFEKLGEAAAAYSGGAAQVVVQRFYAVQITCSIIALLHLTAEWLYSGKPWKRATLLLLGALMGVSLIGSFWLQPRLKSRHFARFNPNNDKAARVEASRSYRLFQGASFALNLASMAGTALLLWRVANPPDPDRYLNVNKFRG